MQSWNDRMITVCFWGKPFNITVIQVYAQITKAKEAEVELFYEDLQDLLELTLTKDVLFIIGDWNAKVGSQEIPGSVQFSRSVVSDSWWPHESQHARPPCPSPTSGVHSNSHPSSLWCHSAISSSVVPFSSYPQSLPASESFPMSQLFAWGGQSTGVSASASVLPMNTQDWSPSELTGWISLQSQGLSRVFSNTTVQKHQFFGYQVYSQQSCASVDTWPSD